MQMKKRSLIIYGVLLFFMMGIIIRVYAISSQENLAEAGISQTTYTLNIETDRGMIYDRNFEPLVEETGNHVAAVLPSNETLAALSPLIEPENREWFYNKMQGSLPFIMPVSSFDLIADGVSLFKTTQRYSQNQLARHVIGYVDSTGENGLSGIEKAYNDILATASGSLSVSYAVTAWNNTLSGTVPEVTDARENARQGVVLTLDKDIQRAVEYAMRGNGDRSSVEKGAAVVMDVESGDILAMVSMPEFDPNDIEAGLTNVNSPFVNRALAAYNIGSTFKLVVAAAALENGIPVSQLYNCTGSLQVSDILFHCHKEDGHGWLTMRTATMYSCNVYFIQLGRQTGAGSILSMASSMGFGQADTLCDGIVTSAGNLPDADKMTVGDVANISFGQGDLLATPVQLCKMISAIANGGLLPAPSLVKGITDSTGTGIETPSKQYSATRVMQQETADTIKQFLIDTVESGTGIYAKPEVGGAGGKTSSAQTGVYDENGEEIVHAGFAGFYPAESPKYAIYIVAEGMTSGGEYTAHIFKDICDSIYSIEQKRTVDKAG